MGIKCKPGIKIKYGFAGGCHDDLDVKDIIVAENVLYAWTITSLEADYV
ncbi:MAG: hypothetical protein HUJ51_02185 [Eggerthellaceae bacterium]|nr:hypothetical protein [Eggerthellaceae bacterium]